METGPTRALAMIQQIGELAKNYDRADLFASGERAQFLAELCLLAVTLSVCVDHVGEDEGVPPEADQALRIIEGINELRTQGAPRRAE